MEVSSGETIRCNQTPGQARAWPGQARGWLETYEGDTSLIQAAHRQQGRQAQDRRSRGRVSIARPEAGQAVAAGRRSGARARRGGGSGRLGCPADALGQR